MPSVIPYVMVRSAIGFRAFIEDTFAAQVSNVVPWPSDPDRVLHAEARLRDGVLYFADSGPGGQHSPATPPEPGHVHLWLTVPDPDTVIARALTGGASLAMPITAQDDGSRMGGFVDPFGTLWWVGATAPADDVGE